MNTLIDMTGKQFGRLTVVRKAESRVSPSGNHVTRWHCVCECGAELDVDAYALRSGNTKSCGCHKYGNNLKDITGNTYGQLTVLKLDHIENRKTYWLCECVCGRRIVVPKCNLLNENTKSCGCLKSIGEKEIQDILQGRDINYASNYRFPDLVGPNGGELMFDIAIKDNSDNILCLIEYQGRQHYMDYDFGKVQREITDPLKKKYCSEHHIPLHEIRFDEDIAHSLDVILSRYTPTSCQAQETAKV